MKTPDEIKKGLECCVIGPSAHQPKCGECPYKLVNNCSDVLLKDTAGLVKQLESSVPRWISAEERLPEGEVIALCWDPGAYCYGEYIVGYVSPYNELEGLGFRAENDYELLDGVTHWMPMPEPPKEVTP